MSPLPPNRFRDRALLVMTQLLGEPAEPIETGLPASVRLTEMRLCWSRATSGNRSMRSRFGG